MIKGLILVFVVSFGFAGNTKDAYSVEIYGDPLPCADCNEQGHRQF